MAVENIDGTLTGTGVYNTKIPGLADNADIQVALKLYHYGTTTIPGTLEGVLPGSIAGHLRGLNNRVVTLENQGIGSSYQDEPPTSVPEGFVWIDSNSSAIAISEFQKARYTTTIPTENLVEGQLWVDKDSSPLKMYVYDSVSGWREIGA